MRPAVLRLDGPPRVSASAASEVNLDIHDVIAENAKVLVRLQFRGVHIGPFGDRDATGRRFDVAMLDLFRIDDGSIAEQWPATDNLALRQQIGMIPI